MNGTITTERLYATSNAWGDTVYAGDFGNLDVIYSPYNQTICPLPQFGGSIALLNKDGLVLDTVHSAGTVSNPSTLDVQYAQANEDLLNLDFTSAETIYNSIISQSPAEVTSEEAYLGLYKSARLQDADSSALASLRGFYNSKLDQISYPVMYKVIDQLSLLTLVDTKAYNNALVGFSDIINQNPESEEALFAEIDAMTTSLLADNGNDSTLSKGLAKGLLVKSPADMHNRLNSLIQSKFGLKDKSETAEIIPTEYSLYNNYPNPFNPTTVIRFDIPERTQVELVVYDILGRKVKTLIGNEIKNPGRYDVSFNANSLASGVYIYKLTAKNYSQARKMLLVK